MFAQIAHSADGAIFNPMGFSKDARYFAFEQYGIEDGSGFPYSEIFVIDVINDKWLAGTPIRKRLENEQMLIGEASAASIAAVKPILESLQITEPADILAAHHATEVLADRNSITFDRWYLSSSQGSRPKGQGAGSENRYKVSIEAVALKAPVNCPKEDGDFYGFSLTVKSLERDLTNIVHRDSSIPASRRCPSGYDIQAIVASTGYPKTDVLMAIIGVYSLGFEGSDRRYIAIPFRLEKSE